MAIISTPLGFILRWIYNLVGNYGMSLLIFTVLMKIVLIPISVKQKKSSIRTAAFSPMIQQIQKKYANDPAKQQEELARLQQDHNFSMTGGCGTMAVQMIVLIGLIQVVYRPLQYIIGLSGDVIDRMKPIAEGILVSLSKYSPESGIIAAVRQSPQSFAGIVDAETIRKISSFDFTFLGLDLTVTPSFKVLNGLWLIPIISVVLMLIQQTVTMKMTGQKMEGPMKFMPIWSAAMFLYFGFIMPAGVSIYWIFSSIVGIVQEFIMNIFINPEKEKAIIAREVEEARKRRKEEKKARPEKAKQAIKADKERYVAESARDYDGMDEATRKRLEKARALDREKYGE
ncbi:MAG: membrane protein insertase YidC [Oscillospiraceae bacterium]|nr:membrane protein insertase YidC [Oscillospiraceae bacterium]